MEVSAYKVASSAFGLLAMTLISCLFMAPSANAAIAFVQSESDDVTAASDTLAFGSNNTAGNTIIVAVRQGYALNPKPITISDSAGNTYVQVASQNSSSDHGDFIFAAHNIAAGANTVTCSYNGVSNTMRWAIHEYSGLQVIGAVDQIASATGTSAAPDSGNITTTQADTLLFGFASVDGAQTFTAGGSYTLRESVASKIGTQDRIVSATGTYSADFSLSGSDTWAALIVAFKQSDGLVGWWKLDDASGASAIDSSGYAHTGTFVGNTAWATGLRGGAITTDGSGDYLNAGTGGSIDLAATGSVAAWLKYPSNLGFNWRVYQSKYDCANDINGYLMTIRFDAPQIWLGNAVTYNVIVGSTAYSDNRWHHIVGTWDGSFLRIYVDGRLDSTPVAQTITPVSSSQPLYIGSCSTTGHAYDGLMDDVRIYNRALSVSEIQGLYAGGRTGNAVLQNGGMNQ